MIDLATANSGWDGFRQAVAVGFNCHGDSCDRHCCPAGFSGPSGIICATWPVSACGWDSDGVVRAASAASDGRLNAPVCVDNWINAKSGAQLQIALPGVLTESDPCRTETPPKTGFLASGFSSFGRGKHRAPVRCPPAGQHPLASANGLPLEASTSGIFRD